jgi:hypothetical protein
MRCILRHEPSRQYMAAIGPSSPGRARQLCPGISDLDFLGDLNRIVDLDAKISNRAFDLRVAQQ